MSKHSTQEKGKGIWAFDFGTSSLGVAVRGYKKNPNEFSKSESLLFPDGFASTKDARERRCAYRTRQSHLRREEWLQNFFTDADLVVLEGRKGDNKGDPRLEREFPKKGENVCYTGCLLRIKLIQNEKLEEWQLFKAFHSAIQKRGYDENVAWKNKNAEKRKDQDDVKEEQEKRSLLLSEFDADVKKFPEKYQYPCYWEAKKMGLWSLDSPEELKFRQNCHAENAKTVYPREIVVRELRKMVQNAISQYPKFKIKGKTDKEMEDYFLYGNAYIAYASYFPEERKKYYERTGKKLVQGKNSDWQGVLSQKVPTFDNRSLNKCALIPRFNVCKKSPRVYNKELIQDSTLVAEVTLLMKLKNIRAVDQNGEQKGLKPDEVKEIYNDCMAEYRGKIESHLSKGNDDEKTKRAGEELQKAFKFTKTKLKRKLSGFEYIDIVSDEEGKKHPIESPKVSGHSRYSRPALQIVREIILSGLSPAEFRKKKTGIIKIWMSKFKLSKSDLDFIDDMGDSWEKFHIPDGSLSYLDRFKDKGQKIKKLIANQKDPIVRHRLEFFYKKICDLHHEFGENPECIVLEFVRDDFLGKEAINRLKKFQRDRQNVNDETDRNPLVTGHHSRRMVQLLNEQKYQCVYTGECLPSNSLDKLDIDHIVPISQGGPPGAIWNQVVCHLDVNRKRKMDKIPYEWLHSSGEWSAYKERVENAKCNFGKKKCKLLLSPDAKELADRYTTLAETAWIAKLAQKILCLYFNWDIRFSDERRRIIVVPGGLTNKIAKKYHLYDLLGGEERADERKEVKEFKKSREQIRKALLNNNLDDEKKEKLSNEISDIKRKINEINDEKKLRKDKRHHALDAMVISFLPQWVVAKEKRDFFCFPNEVEPLLFFRKELDKVHPINIAFDKPVLRETIYGCRKIESKDFLTYRVSIESLAYTGHPPKFNATYLEKICDRILDNGIRSIIKNWMENNASVNEEKWKKFCNESIRLKNGPVVKKVRIKADASFEEAKDMAKENSFPGAYKIGKTGGKKGHRGQIVYKDKRGRVSVRPIYVHESAFQVKKEILENEEFEYIDFFQTGCRISWTREMIHTGKIYPPGEYMLNTITNRKQVKFTDRFGTESPRVSLRELIECGLRRVD